MTCQEFYLYFVHKWTLKFVVRIRYCDWEVSSISSTRHWSWWPIHEIVRCWLLYWPFFVISSDTGSYLHLGSFVTKTVIDVVFGWVTGSPTLFVLVLFRNQQSQQETSGFYRRSECLSDLRLIAESQWAGRTLSERASKHQKWQWCVRVVVVHAIDWSVSKYNIQLDICLEIAQHK